MANFIACGSAGSPSLFERIPLMNRTFFVRTSFLSACAVTLGLAVACGGPTASDGGSGGSGNGNGNPGIGDGDLDPGIGDGDLDPGLGDGDGDGDTREPECDPVTGVCICIKLATWGALGTFGAVPGMDGTDAITEYLNMNSTGEADYSATKPAVTADYLANYDVIILQDLSAWPAFTAEEVAAFDAWVAAGGGVISLNGYSDNDNEMTNVNTLLASSGMSYVPASDTSGDNTGVECAYCFGNSVPQAGWNAAHPITTNLTQVGAFHGRSIVPGDAEIVAQTADGVVGAAKQVGEGRVFMFHDEWVTYNSQWTGVGITGSESCKNMHDACFGFGPAEKYSSAQFWFNSIKWLSGDIACFDIVDPTIIK